jgi:hypothetical protein
MSEFILTNKSNEEIKTEVLTMLYETGRINGLYFGRKSRANHNGIKGYINMWLKRFKLDQIENDLCSECYNTVFFQLWNIKAEKIVEIVKESPNKLIAIACKIVLRHCFSKKPNPNSSGIVWNILNNSSHGNIEINTSEVLEDVERGNCHSSIILIDDDVEDDFGKQYGFSIEDIIELMSPDEKQFFYEQLGKQSVGKPSKEMVQKRLAFAERMKEVKKELENK